MRAHDFCTHDGIIHATPDRVHIVHYVLQLTRTNIILCPRFCLFFVRVVQAVVIVRERRTQ